MFCSAIETAWRAAMRMLLHHVWNLVRDVAYGVHAGHAIRHGVPVPVRKPPS